MFVASANPLGNLMQGASEAVRAHNPECTGSTPVPASIFLKGSDA